MRLRPSCTLKIIQEQHRFNSIVVRLRLGKFRVYEQILGNFNSIVVRLRPLLSNTTGYNNTDFNSIVVRLRLPKDTLIRFRMLHFNSIVVRLRLIKAGCPEGGVVLFQFYSSAIKTRISRNRMLSKSTISIL